ncbi:hypothetical protein SBADM41S_09213 [Streptomyces badius]
MEQSIDSNKKPEFAAGTDPAFIPLPGLAAPAGTRKPEAEAGPEAEGVRDDEAGPAAAEGEADGEPEAVDEAAAVDGDSDSVCTPRERGGPRDGG